MLHVVQHDTGVRSHGGNDVIFNSPERVAALTPLNLHERFPDGRPRVPDDILERMRQVTNDEAWGVVERGHGYHFQFEGDWVNLHPDRVLVGRAVTVRMVPLRHDFHGMVEASGFRDGRSGSEDRCCSPGCARCLRWRPRPHGGHDRPRRRPPPARRRT